MLNITFRAGAVVAEAAALYDSGSTKMMRLRLRNTDVKLQKYIFLYEISELQSPQPYEKIWYG
jgi:hypothetical protein